VEIPEKEKLSADQDKDLELSPLPLKSWIEDSLKAESDESALQKQDREQKSVECDESESMRGWLYMIDKITSTKKESSQITLRKVFIELGHGVLSIGETDQVNDKITIIKSKYIYPRA
jgi:hypothetical protein